MSSNLIATTPKASMHALAFKGIMAYASFPQIRDMLLRKFGDEYVLLFARPAENRADGQLDWYTPVQGAARPFPELTSEEQAPVYKHIENMVGNISSYADELIASADPLKVTRGNILKLALCYPDENAIYVIGGQPVLTCWGFGPGTPGVEAKNLTRLAQPASPRPAVAPPLTSPAEPASPRPQRGCLFPWLMAILPLLLLLLLLFSSFGQLGPLSGVTLLRFPPLPFVPEIADHSNELAQMEARLLQLRADVEKRAAMCTPQKPQPSQNTLPAAKAQKPLVIPEKAQDTTFLEGSWICETGLASKRTGEPVQFSFSFDKSGKGRGVVLEKNDRCTGSASAEMREGILHIALDQQKCANSGSIYDSVTIECRNTLGSSAKCQGTNADGSTWNGIFLRY